MVIIIIRRFVRPDRIEIFLEKYRQQAPIDNPAFRGEILARVSDISSLPEAMRKLASREAGEVTVLNIATWDSWDAFAEHFEKEIAKADAGVFDPNVETRASDRILLDVIEEHGGR